MRRLVGRFPHFYTPLVAFMERRHPRRVKWWQPATRVSWLRLASQLSDSLEIFLELGMQRRERYAIALLFDPTRFPGLLLL